MKKKLTKKQKKYLKITIAFGLAIIVVSVGLAVAKKIIERKRMDLRTYVVRAEQYQNVIEIAGTVCAAQEQALQALGDGTVLKVAVKKGDKVKKGDLILQLDSTEQEYNLAKLDYEMASTKVSGSKKEYELQEKQRLSLLRKIEDRSVKATFDGFIADLDVDVGDSLEAKDKVGTLVNTDYLTAEVEVTETDVAKLNVNQTVLFSFPAYNGIVEGRVISWPQIGTVTSRGSTVVNAKIRIDDYPAQILPNYSFTGKIEITEPETNLIVERYAIGYEDGNSFVVTTDGKRIEVKVRPYNAEFVKILEGLSGGEELKAQSTPKTSGWNKNGGERSGAPGGGARGRMGAPMGMPPM